tara:strand:- start:1327 stop:2046 length:720 start_codon:yes stop_codon:yes gene_type:complete
MASYGFLGLLGGLGQAAQTVGGALFSEGIDRRREERLQAYQDRVYERARKDAVADMDRSEAFQTAQQEALFGQQKSMAKLEFANRKNLEKYIRENFAQSKLGRQYADLERYRNDPNFGVESDEYKRLDRALTIQEQQLIPTTDMYGNTTYGIAQYDESGRITGVKQVDFTEATGLGGGDESTGTVTDSDTTPAPSSTARQIAGIQEAIDAGPDEDGLYTHNGQKVTLQVLQRALTRLGG